jgi:glycine cleavage system H protein
MYPSNYKYTREHQWVDVQDDNAIVGLTDFAQREMGEVVFIELPEEGQVFQMEDGVGTVESVKAVLEIYSPLSGTITEVNYAVVDDPELFNDDPHGEGWLVKIRYTNASELDNLMNHDTYEDYIKAGMHDLQ